MSKLKSKRLTKKERKQRKQSERVLNQAVALTGALLGQMHRASQVRDRIAWLMNPEGGNRPVQVCCTVPDIDLANYVAGGGFWLQLEGWQEAAEGSGHDLHLVFEATGERKNQYAERILATDVVTARKALERAATRIQHQLVKDMVEEVYGGDATRRFPSPIDLTGAVPAGATIH